MKSSAVVLLSAALCVVELITISLPRVIQLSFSARPSLR